MKTLARAFILWLPLAAAITGLSMLIYVSSQQVYRQSLNDPQVQMARDGARALARGVVSAELVPRGVPPVDIAVSLAPYLVVYDELGTVLESSGVLDGAPPKPPMGVFASARGDGGFDLKDLRLKALGAAASGENRVSWQPRPDVRSAIVVVHVNGGKGGFVLAGRNMSETEERVGELGTRTFLGWLATMSASLVLAVAAALVLRRF